MRKPKYSERNLFHFHNIHSKYFWNWAIFTPNITKTGQYSLQFYRNWAIFTPNITETGQYSLKILLKSGNIHSKYYWNQTIFTPNITETGQYSLQKLLKPGVRGKRPTNLVFKQFWNQAGKIVLEIFKTRLCEYNGFGLIIIIIIIIIINNIRD